MLGRNYPQQTDQSVANNGYNDDMDLCNAFDTEGRTHGLPGSFSNHVDYGNQFVGQYSAGDIQYSGHHSVENIHLIYWKETKNFQNECGSHLLNGYYSEGLMMLPDQATFIIDNTVIDDDVMLFANHHCNVGVTGFLCMPQYILHNVKWNNQNRNKEWIKFQFHNTQGHNANQNHVSIVFLLVIGLLFYHMDLLPHYPAPHFSIRVVSSRCRLLRQILLKLVVQLKTVYSQKAISLWCQTNSIICWVLRTICVSTLAPSMVIFMTMVYCAKRNFVLSKSIRKSSFPIVLRSY